MSATRIFFFRNHFDNFQATAEDEGTSLRNSCLTPVAFKDLSRALPTFADVVVDDVVVIVVGVVSVVAVVVVVVVDDVVVIVVVVAVLDNAKSNC